MTVQLIIKSILMMGSFGFLMLTAGDIVKYYSSGTMGAIYKFSEALTGIGFFSLRLACFSVVAGIFYYFWMFL